MGNFRSIIHIFYEMVGNVFATLELTWYYVRPTRASWTACAHRGMLFIKDLSRLGLMASVAAITASCNCCSVVRGLSILRIYIAIWSQICSIWFLSGLLVGQSMTSTSWFSITRPTLERRATLGHLRSINPNMINHFASPSKTCQVFEN